MNLQTNDKNKTLYPSITKRYEHTVSGNLRMNPCVKSFVQMHEQNIMGWIDSAILRNGFAILLLDSYKKLLSILVAFHD